MLLGLILRLGLSQLGYNHDITAYYHVGEIITEGEIVYAVSNKFNYGFIMAYVFGGCFWVNKTIGYGTMQGMHALVCLICALFDLLIALQLKRRFGNTIAFFFYFNPISLLITGYHSQFDTIAIYFGLKFWFSLEDKKPLFNAAIWLGISLIIKHVFLLFLPWLLFSKQYSLKQRLVLFTTPLFVFLLSFSLFMLDPAARTGIFAHVFSYNSFEQHSLIGIICRQIPHFEHFNLHYFDGNLKKYLFMSMLSLLGYFVMQRTSTKSIYIYLWALVGLSSGMTDQYLAITCVSTAVFYRCHVLKIFVLIASSYLLFDSRNNISGSITSLQYFSTNYTIVALILSVATCQLLLVIGLIKAFIYPPPKT